MKLLLDEHFSPDMAESLRDHGHDVVAVAARPDLRGGTDIDILTAAAHEQRVLVTGDIADFMALGTRRLPDLHWHTGIVLVATRTFPTSSQSFGRLVRALDALLEAHSSDDTMIGDIVWLRPVPDDVD